jgi:hypothetical protein
MGLGNRNVTVQGRLNPRPSAAAGAVEATARQIADQIIRERDFARQRSRNGRVYTPFNPTDDVLPNNIEIVTKGLFSGNTGSLLNFHTQSSATAIQNTYFRQIYNEKSTNRTAQPQFSIAYGHYLGSGSKDLTGNLNDDTPSRAIYKQYAQLLLQPLDKKFTINGQDTDSIYVLNFNRARFREKLDPGNLEINLSQLSGAFYANRIHTGSNVKPTKGAGVARKVISLIDDSSLSSARVVESGRVYNIVSGTIDDGTVIHKSSAPHYYGLIYPEAGVIILDAKKLDISCSFNTVTGSGVQGDNAMKLFRSISGSAVALAPSGRNFGLQARSSEQVKSTYLFVRVKNGDYNYSNNPSFVSGSNGDLAYSTFINNPQTYITTVGLYNDRKELLAVAKMSQPILKSFTREVLIKVKLDF